MIEAGLAVGACFLGSRVGTAGAALPIPCAPGACGKGGASQFVTSGTATSMSSGNAMTVTQATNAAVLNWSSFNIGAGGSVTFKQPSSSAIALNRIYQGSPSQIFGKLSANGQVYLINLNGFLFGSTSTVNVGGLLASSLPLSLSDANFGKGILSPLQSSQSPVLDATLDPLAVGGRTSVLDMNGNPVLDSAGKPLTVQILVQPGANITAADQGRVLLAGQSVTNGGTITAPDGQVILAAGTQVFLQADSDPALRGLIVEVDGSGTATNAAGGTLSTPRGNVTLVGLAVNQSGRISATTSVSANGSIRLEAANAATTTLNSTQTSVASSQGGTLTIGPGSEMDILPEVSSTATAVPSQTQYPSTITLLGEQVLLEGGSITAPGGALTAVAAANPGVAAVAASSTNPTKIAGVLATPDPNARLRIDPGTDIDLSGSSATLPVSANLVSAQLRSSELADDPTQRNGALHGVTVYIDQRNPPPATLADLSGEIAAVPETIAQRTEAGGNAVFQSEGDIVFAKGASLNLSGGSTTYAGGVLQTSYLVGANGQLYPIATANPLLTYVGVVNPTFSQTYDKWGVQEVLPQPGLSSYQPGYVEGAAAGTVQFAARNLVLQGSLQATATNGLYQRTPGTAVAGGELTIGVPGGVAPVAGSPLDYLSPAVTVTTSPLPIVVADDASLPGALTLDLPASYLTSSGITSTQINSNYGVTLSSGTPLSLPSGSSLTVNAARIDVLSSISAAGGTLDFQNVFTLGDSVASAQRAGIFVGNDVTFDVRGLWTNDTSAGLVAPTSALWQNGGTIELGTSSVGALLSLGNDDTLRASGGAWLSVKDLVTAGTGGTISLVANSLAGGFDVGTGLAVDGYGVNGAAGGKFTLVAPRIEIANGSGAWTQAQIVDDAVPAASGTVGTSSSTSPPVAPGGVFKLYSSLFSNFGFDTFDLAATGLQLAGSKTTNVLTVDSGTHVDATVNSLMLGANPSLHPSASNLDRVASAAPLAPYQRPAASVNLSALAPSAGSNPAGGGTSVGDLTIGAGASITTDPGGTITLTSLGSLVVDGELKAPGGSVALQILSPTVIASTGSYSGFVIDGADYTNFEAGFLPNQRIELGSGIIDVSGGLVSKPSSAGLYLGSVSAGGSVSLLADRGAVVTDPGSLISIAGTSALLDLPQSNGTTVRESVATAAGSMTVQSGESISLLGGLDAMAGSGGTTGTAAAGSLSIALTRSESWWATPPIGKRDSFNQSPLTVEIAPSVTTASAAGSNVAMLGVAQLAQSGLDALSIEAGGSLLLSNNVSLALGRQLIVNAPVIAATGGGSSSISAPYLEVGYELTGLPSPNGNSATFGGNALNFSGAEIDLVGNTVFQGTSSVRFASSGDLVLRGVQNATGDDLPAGSLSIDGSLFLDAARIYPETLTAFSITAGKSANGQGGSVTVGQTGASAGAPFSAGGSLTITAADISSTGTLFAPFGSISLNAANSLTLGDGSLTSVSGTGLTIPYGQTEFGGETWLYEGYGNQTITGIPTRSVNLTAPSLTIAKQATVDLTGGGDLSAFEWVPGPGGTVDALANGTKPGLYAILPATVGQAAPQDLEATAGSTILAGETVYLSGTAGLAAGYYPLLPARYALTPGAFLIQVEPSYQSATAGSLGSLADGTAVVAGYLSYGSTGLHQSPGYTGFAVYPGSYGSQLAAYDVTLASSYFSNVATLAGSSRPNLPSDAGSLSISVISAANSASALDITGLVKTAAASGGAAAPISISASDLVIGTASGTLPMDAVSVAGTVLQSWHPGSLLLGGTSTADGSSINVSANTVTVGSGTALVADQIVVVSNQSIDIQNGASLQSTSASTGKALTALPTAEAVALTGSGNGAAGLLAVSDLNWLIPTRTGGASSAGGATMAIDGGANIASRGALTFDAPGGVALNGAVSGAGAAWSLGSSSIAFVPAGSTADSLSINPSLSADLGAAGAVRLASTGSIDLWTPVSLGIGTNGSPTLTALTLSAGSLNNLTGTGGVAGSTTSQLGAKTVTLTGSGAAATSATVGPSGADLTLVAGELDVGPNAFAVNGFGATNANVSGDVVGRGTGSLNVGGNLSLTAVAVTAATAANTTIDATGSMAVAPSAGGGKLPQFLGGEVNLNAASIDVTGAVLAPSGIVKLGTSAGDVTLGSAATLSAAGAMVPVGNQMVSTGGGSIVIDSAANLTMTAGGILNVSGAGTSAGGSIDLSAVGNTALGAVLKGGGGTSAAGGSFAVDTGTLGGGTTSLDGLAANLTQGGFSNAIDVRVRGGSLLLDAGSTLTANSVTLTADTGTITVGGQISAPSGALRGSLSLFGGTGVDLTAGSVLRADGSGSTGIGGTIEIGTGELVADASGVLDAYNDAVITLDPHSVMSAAGTAGMGTLLLRAPALLSSNDVAITSLPTDTSAIGNVIIEPVMPFNTSAMSSATAPTAADFQAVEQSVANYMAVAGSAMSIRLGRNGANPLVVEPGVEIDAPGSLTLQSADGASPALDLSASGSNWRFSNAPIDLTIRAAGDIDVNNTVSDGFADISVGRVTQPVLLSGASSTFRLVAGADLSSANPLAVVAAGGAGNLSIAQGVVVRTGTGSIDLVAANDVVLDGAGSGAYTAGTPAVLPNGTAINAGIDPKIGTVSQQADGTVSGVLIPGSSLLMSFPTGGGSLLVRAGADIVNTATSPADGVTAWQLREGGSQYTPAGGGTAQITPVEWGVNLAAYDWNFGTLGGGDLRVSAGGNADNISLAAANSLLPQAAGATPKYVNSGGLSFSTGGDIGSAQVFLADGVGAVTAGGGLTAILPSVLPNDLVDVGSAFYLQSSSLTVTARLGIAADGVYNPTAIVQPLSTTEPGRIAPPLTGFFYTYDDSTALNLQSVSGDVTMGLASGAESTLLGPSVGSVAISSPAGAGTIPGSFSVEAINGSIDIGTGFGAAGVATLFASPTGQLNLAAAQNITGILGATELAMADAVQGSFPTVGSPLGGQALTPVNFSGDIHNGDASPALITAGGDITDLNLSVPKAAQVIAGRDIVDLTYTGQNLSANDETLISAGRDFVYDNLYTGTALSVGGPGRLDVLAGRNVSLGFSDGIATTGNLLNPDLPTPQGADLTVVTGLGTTPDYAAFLSKIIAPSTTYQGQLVTYVESLEGTTGLTFAAAQSAFAALGANQQRPLIDSVFFSELLISGRAANDGTGVGFTEGYAAIDTLFPGSRSGVAGAVANSYAGNLSLDFTRIYTLSGGNISLIVPGGSIDVGLASAPSFLFAKAASSLGIVAEGTGNVDVYSQGDVNVNSSRIFTLGGGNIEIWSDQGSIDAGRGAKTAVSAPPPSVLINSDGTVSLNFSGATAGSGIRTIQTNPDTPLGNVDLIAPVGTVDAGDAGIGAAGDINVAARDVVGLSNITFGGTSTGVPSQVSNIGASLAGASNAASASSNTSTNSVAANTAEREGAAPLSQSALSWLDVFVTGLGEENCKPDDIDCLKRQKTAVQ